MLHLTPADAILLAALVIGAPVYSYFAGMRIARGEMRPRGEAYVRSILSQWAIALTTLFLWWRLGRPFSALGLVARFDWPNIVAAIACVLILAYMNGQLRVLDRWPPEKRQRLRNAFGRAAAVIPRTPAEYRLFLAVSFTAGICEELVYRGYLFAVTAPFITLYGAVAASALIFGLAHVYQGWRNVLRTALAGLAFGLIYAGTGSILLPMLLHALVDVRGGTLGYRLFRERS